LLAAGAQAATLAHPTITAKQRRRAIVRYALGLHVEGATHYHVGGCWREAPRIVPCGYALIGSRKGRPFECIGTAVAVARRRRMQVLPDGPYEYNPWIITLPRFRTPIAPDRWLHGGG
jgi:hypothetical protein